MQTRGPAWLWLAVGYMFSDCVASIKLCTPVNLPPTHDAGGGGSSGGSSALAMLVDKASLRFFKFQRGELVVLRWAWQGHRTRRAAWSSGGGPPCALAPAVPPTAPAPHPLQVTRGAVAPPRAPPRGAGGRLDRGGRWQDGAGAQGVGAVAAVPATGFHPLGRHPASCARLPALLPQPPPQGNCWVEADSGAKAAGGDSLVSWGAVPLALVEGRVSHVLWPPARWGRLPPRPSASRVVGKASSLEFLHPPAAEHDWWS